MTSKRIAVIPGDGIGVDVTAEAVKVLEAVASLEGFSLELTDYDSEPRNCSIRRSEGRRLDGMRRRDQALHPHSYRGRARPEVRRTGLRSPNQQSEAAS